MLTGNGNCKLCAGGTFFVGALSGAKAHCVCYNGGDPAKNCGCGTGFTASKLPGIQCSPICPSNQVLSASKSSIFLLPINLLTYDVANTCACQDSLRSSLVDSTKCVPACPASTFATLNSGKDFCAPICQPPSLVYLLALSDYFEFETDTFFIDLYQLLFTFMISVPLLL